SLDDVFTVLDAAVAHERGHFLQERRRAVVVIADDEAANHRSLHEDRPEIGPGYLLRRIVFRDQPAQGNAGTTIQQLQHRVEDGVAHVLEIDVDAPRARGPQPCAEIVRLVIDARVEPELADDIPAFLIRTGHTHR